MDAITKLPIFGPVRQLAKKIIENTYLKFDTDFANPSVIYTAGWATEHSSVKNCSTLRHIPPANHQHTKKPADEQAETIRGKNCQKEFIKAKKQSTVKNNTFSSYTYCYPE